MTPIIVNLAKTAAHMYMRVRSFVLSSHSSYCCSNSPAGAGTYMHAVRSIKRAAAFTSHVTPPGWKDAYPAMQNPLIPYIRDMSFFDVTR